jgi:hypothetical protein
VAPVKPIIAYAVAVEMRGERDIWWVDASSRESLVEGLREVAIQAGASRTEAREVWRTGESAKGFLWVSLHENTSKPWVLIIDNADETGMVGQLD